MNYQKNKNFSLIILPFFFNILIEHILTPKTCSIIKRRAKNMPIVQIDGVYMGANPKSSTYEGVTKQALYIDIYQPDSPDTEKTLQLKSDDIGLLVKLGQEYMMGTPFSCKASLNAYKNKAYFKLVEIIS
jgi:hypothetical protein